MVMTKLDIIGLKKTTTGKIGLYIYCNGFQIVLNTLRGQTLMLDFCKI